jgi:hypothetical protein
MKKISQEEAIEIILAAGWQPWYPVENVPLNQNSFWDGVNNRVGYGWLSAYEEIQKRKQLTLFDESEGRR